MDVDAPIAIARLIAELGQVKGRKRLQKLVHLLGAMGFPQFRQRFILHYYGPFSRRLARELDFLGAAGLIEIKEGVAGFSGFTHSVSPSGTKFLEEVGVQDNESEPWVSIARKLNGESTESLEAVSTLVFLHANGTSKASLKARFTDVKPKLTDHFAKARKLAEELSLLDIH